MWTGGNDLKMLRVDAIFLKTCGWGLEISEVPEPEVTSTHICAFFKQFLYILAYWTTFKVLNE